jgi:GNAT superfamily N-acetyltransferase
MVIRRATPADGPAYLSLVQSLAEFEKLPPPDAGARDRLIADAFADPPRYDLWVADDAPAADPIAAYAVTFMTYSTFLARPTLFLEDLFVHPRARRRGIATQMLAHLRDEAEARSCGRFEWNVLDWNVDAQKLYESVGAKMLPDWRLMRVVL